MIRAYIQDQRTLVFLRECRYRVRVVASPFGMMVEVDYNGTVEQFRKFLKRYNKK